MVVILAVHEAGLQIIMEPNNPQAAREILAKGIELLDQNFPNGRPKSKLIVPQTAIPRDITNPPQRPQTSP
jgi:hypothetical protein